MAKTKATKFKGIRYREHKTRKNGVRKDRYFFIRYRLDGKLKEEGWGWESEGFTAKDAFLEREKIMKAIKSGKTVATLADRRAKAKRERIEKAAADEAKKKANVTFDDFFEKQYIPSREPKALKPELSLYEYWIKPVIGAKRFSEITELDMVKIRKKATKKGKSPRTIQYCYHVVRMIFNESAKHKIYEGPCPVTRNINRAIKSDNAKTRFLTESEADQLLEALKKRSKLTHDMALVSLYCGLRAGEVCALDWSDVDLDRGLLTLRDTKSGKNRTVLMPDQVKAMFQAMEPGKGNVPVFVNSKGKRLKMISKTFSRTVAALGLNEGISDRRQKVTFHTLRHTYASWLVQAGTPLLTVQKLLGHSTITMTQRYSHLAPDNFQKAAEILSRKGSKDNQKVDKRKIVNMK